MADSQDTRTASAIPRPISRRALAAGLALAPVAGLPALAGVVSADDPIISALAELDQAKVRTTHFEELCGQASEAYGN